MVERNSGLKHGSHSSHLRCVPTSNVLVERRSGSKHKAHISHLRCVPPRDVSIELSPLKKRLLHRGDERRIPIADWPEYRIGAIPVDWIVRKTIIHCFFKIGIYIVVPRNGLILTFDISSICKRGSSANRLAENAKPTRVPFVFGTVLTHENVSRKTFWLTRTAIT